MQVLPPKVLLALVCATAVVHAPWTGDRIAFAQSSKARAEIEAKAKAAMEAYDGLDFDAAKQGLTEALAVARKAGLSADKVVAQVHLDLGVLYYAGLKDEEAAITAFADAVKLDPKIQIDLAYRTDQMAAVLEEVRQQAGGGRGGSVGTCDGVEGFQHAMVESGSAGKAIEIRAQLGADAGADAVALYYRPPGEVDFTRVAMKKAQGCEFVGAIPAAAVKGDAMHYYVAALRGDKQVDSSGSSGSPNIVELAAAGLGTDDDNPLGPPSIDDDGASPGGRKRVFLAVALGTGGGYVTGQTEVEQSDVGCCFAPALLHLFPEVGYYFSARTSASLAFRMGFALGANVEGHASAAPAVLARVRYALHESGDGIVVSGAVGGGIIRNTVKVEDADAGMDTDTTASGPFLAGIGIGYLKPLSGAMRFVGELNSLAAFPGGIKTIGTCPGAGCVRPNFGFQFDLNLGLLFAF